MNVGRGSRGDTLELKAGSAAPQERSRTHAQHARAPNSNSSPLCVKDRPRRQDLPSQVSHVPSGGARAYIAQTL